MEQLREVDQPRVVQDWAKDALHKEGLVQGKSQDSTKQTEDQKTLTDSGIIPPLELVDTKVEQKSSARRKGLFDQFDSDRNNAVTAKEWMDKFDKVAGDDQQATLKDFFGEFGDNARTARLFRRANTDGGDSVSSVEWLNRYDSIESNRDGNETVSRNEFSSANAKKQGGIFSRIDANHDSQLTAKEWVDKFDKIAGEDQKANEQDFYKAFGHNENTEQFFKAANSKGDGNVTMSEWLRFYQGLEGSDKNFTIDRKEFSEFRHDGGDGNNEQFVHSPDLSKYDSKEHMEFLARLASHDQQLNGSTQPDGPQGTIFLQTLLDAQAGGTLNGQSEIFLKGSTPEETAQRRKWFFDAMADSINPQTGQLDGRVLSQSIVDSVYDASGMDISGSINKSEHRSAQTSAEALSVKGPGDPEDPNFVDNLSKYSGWSKKDIAYDLLWGHAQVFSEDGRVTDAGVRSFLESALNGKDENTSQLIKAFPELEQAARDILKSDHPAETLGEGFLAAQSKQFGVPIEDGESNTGTGDDNYMISNSQASSDQQRSHFFDRFLGDLKRAADTGNSSMIDNTLNSFGDKFQRLANHLLRNRGTSAKDAAHSGDLNVSQRQCPFMALKEKFGGSKDS